MDGADWIPHQSCTLPTPPFPECMHLLAGRVISGKEVIANIGLVTPVNR